MKVNSYEIKKVQLILFFFLACIIFAGVIFIYYAFFAINVFNPIIEAMNLNSDSLGTGSIEPFELSLSAFLVIFLLTFIFLLIDALYLILVRFLYYNKIKIEDFLKIEIVYLAIPFIMLLLSTIYNMFFYLIIDGWSDIALYFFPLIGLFIRYIFIAESLHKSGYNRLQIYLSLSLAILFIIILILSICWSYTNHPYEIYKEAIWAL